MYASSNYYISSFQRKKCRHTFLGFGSNFSLVIEDWYLLVFQVLDFLAYYDHCRDLGLGDDDLLMSFDSNCFITKTHDYGYDNYCLQDYWSDWIDSNKILNALHRLLISESLLVRYLNDYCHPTTFMLHLWSCLDLF